MSGPWGERHALYDIVLDGEVIYVGITVSPKTRMTQHRTDKTAAPDATMQIVSWHRGHTAARKAERKRIEKLKPRLNIYGNPNPTATSARARARQRRADREASRVALWKQINEEAEALMRTPEGRAEFKRLLGYDYVPNPKR